MATENNKCGHDICECPASQNSEYCSDYCRDAEKTDRTEIACNCNHPGCT